MNLVAVITAPRRWSETDESARPGARREHLLGAGRVPLAGGSTYTATKFAVSGFSNALHIELRADRTPIAVTAVHPAIVRTELSRGVKDNRGVSPVTPEDVADAVVDALLHPRPNVYVPASLGVAVRSGALLPQRVGEWLMRALGGERVALDAIGSPERADYEARVAQSAPSLDRSPDKEMTA